MNTNQVANRPCRSWPQRMAPSGRRTTRWQRMDCSSPSLQVSLANARLLHILSGGFKKMRRTRPPPAQHLDLHLFPVIGLLRPCVSLRYRETYGGFLFIDLILIDSQFEHAADR